MKPTIYLPLILSLLLSACSKPAEETTAETTTPETAQSPSATTAPAVTAPAQQPTIAIEESAISNSNTYQPKLLKTIEGNAQIVELQKNIQIMQTAKKNIAVLNAAIGKETDATKKAELIEALNTVEKKHEENNLLMQQTYGINFKGTDEYVFVPQQAQVFVQMSEEEIAKRKEQDPEFKAGEIVFALTKQLNSPQVIQQFQQNLSVVNNMRQQIAQLQQALPKVADEETKAKVEANIAQSIQQLNANDTKLFEAYGYTFRRQSQVNYSQMSVFSQPKLPELNQVSGLANNYVLIGTLNGADVNREFKNNVQVMQRLRNATLSLRQQFAAETDAAKKAQIEEQFNAINAKILENNKEMAKAYKYSLNRSYSQVIKKARIYVKLTEEEIAAQKEQDPEFTAPENGFFEIATINGVKANQEFQANVQSMQLMRSRIIQAKRAIELETDEAKKAEFEKQIEIATQKLVENNQTMVNAYRYSLDRNYQYVVETSDLYLELSRAEISQLEAAKK